MRADAVPVLDLFEKKMRLEVPLFQRQYVWERERQWEPLWEDITRKFTEFIDGHPDTPVHFLGAMVLDQKQTPVTHVEKRQVIDGQQRLTTLQILLAAMRDFCRHHELNELADELEAYTTNRGKMADQAVEKFKVWPTQSDQQCFMDVVGLGSREAVEEKYPVVRRKYKNKPDPRPRLVEAYLYFSNMLTEYFIGSAEEPPIEADQPLEDRMDAAYRALKSALKVVVIDLDGDDDAQIIFETLNARGEPLLPADLLRNYIFLRAARQGLPQEPLYNEYWKPFDETFWREEVRQGRLVRPRSDLFMQHYLSSRRFVDVPVNHLYVEYRYWIEKETPFASIEEELRSLAMRGADFKRILKPTPDDPVYTLAHVMETFDVRTAYPLLLTFLEAEIHPEEWKPISSGLESYIVRRAFLGMTTKPYNRIFLTLAKNLKSEGITADNVRTMLSGLTGESSLWPTDDRFRDEWMTADVYKRLNNARLVYVLRRLSDARSDRMAEDISINNPLSVEHILPRQWQEHWLLEDGTPGIASGELWNLPEDDPRAIATKRRNSLVNTIGNLTIVTQALNSSASNSPWPMKKPALLERSLLPINQRLHAFDIWDEESIQQRARELFEVALELWPGPH